MGGYAGGVHAACADGVEADAYAVGVEADFADDAGFGEDFQRGVFCARGIYVQGDEVRGLGGQPVPVLAEVGAGGRFEGEGCAACEVRVRWGFCCGGLVAERGGRRGGEEAEGDFGADIERQDVVWVGGGAGCHAYFLACVLASVRISALQSSLLGFW